MIEDAAQAPGRAAAGARPGTLGHIGVFSLNYHKTIQCGEGGVAVTDDDRLAERLALARNHGEAVVGRHGLRGADMLGFNYRMGELEAAIAEVQLARLDELTEPRIAHAERLTDGLAGLEGIRPPAVPAAPGTSTTSTRPAGSEAAGRLPRARSPPRSQAEGVPVDRGLRRRRCTASRSTASAPRAAFGDPRNAGLGGYERRRCPTCERVHEHEVLFHPLIHAGLWTRATSTTSIAAFRKVHARRGEL